MLKVHRSPSTDHNESLTEVRRKGREDNAAYVASHASSDGGTNLVLLGGAGPIDFRLRVAQAHVRDDLSPSAWSHVLLVGRPGKAPAKTEAFEIGLHGRGGIGNPAETNGVAKVTLGDYADTARFPNIAVLKVPVPFKKVVEMIVQFETHRSTIDALEHLLSWWGYVWGVGRAANPLLDGVGVPSAVFAEYVLANLGYDLVPGFPTRASCPEAIWLSARWWFKMPRSAEDQAKEGAKHHAIAGVYDAQHYLVPKG